jgi:hypothetical protein
MVENWGRRGNRRVSDSSFIWLEWGTSLGSGEVMQEPLQAHPLTTNSTGPCDIRPCAPHKISPPYPRAQHHQSLLSPGMQELTSLL